MTNIFPEVMGYLPENSGSADADQRTRNMLI